MKCCYEEKKIDDSRVGVHLFEHKSDLYPREKLLNLKSCNTHKSETEVLGDGDGCHGKQNAYDIPFYVDENSQAM